MSDLNAREELEAASHWLGMQHEDLSYGLKTAEDGLKLWRAWTKDQELPEFCDEADDPEDGRKITRRVTKILGYNPWRRVSELLP